MIDGYLVVSTSTCPSGFLRALDSHGSQVTATGILPEAKAAPASPEVMSTCLTSCSDMPFCWSTYASSHWLVEPALTPTDWPLSCWTELTFLSATMPSPPTDASSPST